MDKSASARSVPRDQSHTYSPVCATCRLYKVLHSLGDTCYCPTPLQQANGLSRLTYSKGLIGQNHLDYRVHRRCGPQFALDKLCSIVISVLGCLKGSSSPMDNFLLSCLHRTNSGCPVCTGQILVVLYAQDTMYICMQMLHTYNDCWSVHLLCHEVYYFIRV